MKKRVIVSMVALVVLGVAIFSFIHLHTPESYSSAKKESISFLKRNRDDMEKISVDLLSQDKQISGHYKDRYYSNSLEENFVKFEVDAQGMLGGQYWSLIYTKDGTLFGESEQYLNEEIDGNNIVIAEKIDDHWWFYWIDYDGTEKSYK